MWGVLGSYCNIRKDEDPKHGGRESRDGVQRGMKGSYMDTL